MIRAIERILPPIAWPVAGCAIALTVLGLVGIYSGEADLDGPPARTIRQAAFWAVGLAAMGVVQAFGYRRVRPWAYALFAVVLALLALLIVARYVPMTPFIEPRRRAYRWIALGPVNVQVSDCAKIAYILALAAYLRYRTSYRTFAGLLPPFILTLVPVGLILKEPDLGTSLLLPPVLLVMLFVAGAKVRHLLIVLLLGAVSAPVLYFSPIMSEYQRERLRAMIRQTEGDAHWRMNEGYQLSQSKIALGSGRWFGRGFHEGAFFRHNLLPEEHNDFIFAVVGHQWGFVGCALVLACYLVIVVVGLTIASMTTDPFGRLVAVGVSALLLVQMLINVGMTVGLMPITGMSLPFVSMGGSGLVTNYIGLGLLMSVARRPPPDIGRRPFEFDDDGDT